jgi:hypothetical protein
MHKLVGLSCVLAACGSVGASNDAAPDMIVDDGAVDAPDAALVPIPEGLIIAFDGACPSGFMERTDLANKYLRGHDGDAMYGETGGAMVHTHGVGAHGHTTTMAGTAHSHQVSLASNNQTHLVSRDGADPGASASHSHTVSLSMAGGLHAHELASAPGFTTESAPNDPLYREVVLCEVIGAPTLLPATAIALASTSCATDWTSIAGSSGRLLRGHDLDGNLEEIGGAATHVHRMTHAHGDGLTAMGGEHTHTGTTSAPSSTIADVDHLELISITSVAASSSTHTHVVTITGGHQHTVPNFDGFTGVETAMPQSRELLACRANAPAAMPLDALALSTEPCPTGWIEVIEFRDRFLAGDDGDGVSGEIVGGAHAHGAAHDHGATGATDHVGAIDVERGTSRFVRNSSDLGSSPMPTHVHNATATRADMHAHATLSATPDVESVEALPPFVEVVVCRREVLK